MPVLQSLSAGCPETVARARAISVRAFIVGKLLDKGDATYGFDAQNGTYVDMVKAGIVDPTKVVRLALQNAASVAGLLITTEAMVANAPDADGGPAMPPGGGMGGMGF